HRLIGEAGRADIEHGDIDIVAAAGLAAARERGEHRDGRIHARHDVDDRHPDFFRAAARLVVGLAGDAHQATHGLDHEILGGSVAPRPGLAEAGDGAVDQSGIERLEVVIAQPETLERADLEILQHDVGARRQRPHDLLALGLVELDGDRTLAAIDAEIIAGLARLRPGLVFQEGWTPGAGIIAKARPLYLHHFPSPILPTLPHPRPP